MPYSPPLVIDETPDVINTSHRLCPVALYRTVTAAGTSASAAPVANQAYYLPIYIPTPKIFKRAFWYAGTTVTGNVDVGLHRYSDGAKIVSTGAVGVGTTGVVNDAALTDQTVTVLPDWYWLSISASATTANLFMTGSSLLYRAFGVKIQATAHPLPATAAPAAFTPSQAVPIFGLTSKTFV